MRKTCWVNYFHGFDSDLKPVHIRDTFRMHISSVQEAVITSHFNTTWPCITIRGIVVDFMPKFMNYKCTWKKIIDSGFFRKSERPKGDLIGSFNSNINRFKCNFVLLLSPITVLKLFDYLLVLPWNMQGNHTEKCYWIRLVSKNFETPGFKNDFLSSEM